MHHKTASMMNPQHVLFVFCLGFCLGILTLQLQNNHVDNQELWLLPSVDDPSNHHPLDPFPLPPCRPNRTSAVYVFYGRPIGSLDGNQLFGSIRTLLESDFPGTIRVVVDPKVNQTIRGAMRQRDLLDKVSVYVADLPDLNGKELIPHSNKIRALQSGALVHGTDPNECTVSLDSDTYIHKNAPWNKLLSILQLNDIAVSHDCDVLIKGVPDFLNHWMPNTGVLAMRNTPRVRRILKDWLGWFRPCNATHVNSCTPGTDQYPFLQLAVKHAARLYPLDNSWNCRITPSELEKGITEFPVHSLTVLSTHEDPQKNNANISTTCAGYRACHILHGHWLEFP